MNKETLREKMRELELNASLTDLFFNLFPRLNVDELFNITKAVKEIFNRHSFISQSESKQTDSNEVKELVELLDEHIYGTKHKEDLADAILQAGYTKNKGEKVWEGFFDNNLTCLEIGNEIWEKFPEKNIQVFIREVE